MRHVPEHLPASRRIIWRLQAAAARLSLIILRTIAIHCTRALLVSLVVGTCLSIQPELNQGTNPNVKSNLGCNGRIRTSSRWNALKEQLFHFFHPQIEFFGDAEHVYFIRWMMSQNLPGSTLKPSWRKTSFPRKPLLCLAYRLDKPVLFHLIRNRFSYCITFRSLNPCFLDVWCLPSEALSEFRTIESDAFGRIRRMGCAASLHFSLHQKLVNFKLLQNAPSASESLGEL